MTWFLLVAGAGLIVWGLWGPGSPVPPRAQFEDDDPRTAHGEEAKTRAWEVLASPVDAEPGRRPPRSERFIRGAATGVGAGLLVVAVVVGNWGTGPAPGGPAEPPVGRAPGEVKPPVQAPGTGTQQPGGAQPPPVGAPPPQPAAPRPVTFTVEPGDFGSAIGERLVTSGVITDAAKFVDRLQERELESALKTGTFELRTGMTIDEVIDKLTS